MTVSITATPEPANAPPRVRLNVTSDQATVTLYRVAPDGTRALVRTYDGGPQPISGGVAVVYDPEAPQGVPVFYTADGTGVTNSATVTVDSGLVWLVHPGIPVLSQPITVSKFGARELDAAQSVRYPLGRRYPIVATDGRRKAPVYELELLTQSLDSLGDLDDLLDDVAPLMLSVPASREYGVTAEYVAVGKITQGRVVRFAGEPARLWTLPCSVVARPVGGSRADVTYSSSLASYATYNDRFAGDATYVAALQP